MTNLPVNPKPNINRKLVPRKTSEKKYISNEVLQKGLKIIEKNQELIERFSKGKNENFFQPAS